MARIRRVYDEAEVDEIIKLRLERINGIVQKLSYNGVSELNKEIANNPDYKRENGELFKLYPYDFWGGGYKGEDNYGKQRIDYVKSQRSNELFSNLFEQGVQDVLLLINDYHQNPTQLSNRVVKIFQKDREKIKRLEKNIEQLEKQNKNLKETLEAIQKAVYTIFYNSSSIKNSLINVMQMNRLGDDFMAQQLKYAFSNQEELLEQLQQTEQVVNTSKVVNIKKQQRAKEFDDLGL